MDTSVCHRSCTFSNNPSFTGIANHSCREECRISNSLCDFSFTTLTGISEGPAILGKEVLEGLSHLDEMVYMRPQPLHVMKWQLGQD